MVWWQWIVLGIVLLGAEMMVDADFFLVFLGISNVASMVALASRIGSETLSKGDGAEPTEA